MDEETKFREQIDMWEKHDEFLESLTPYQQDYYNNIMQESLDKFFKEHTKKNKW